MEKITKNIESRCQKLTVLLVKTTMIEKKISLKSFKNITSNVIKKNSNIILFRTMRFENLNSSGLFKWLVIGIWLRWQHQTYHPVMFSTQGYSLAEILPKFIWIATKSPFFFKKAKKCHLSTWGYFHLFLMHWLLHKSNIMKKNYKEYHVYSF